MAKTVDLNSLCSDVIDCPHSTPVWQNEGVYVVRNFNIKHGELDFSEASYVDEETYKTRTQRAVPEEGDLIISREAPMGDVCIIPHGIKCCLGQRVVLLKVNKDFCNPSFLVFAILSDYVQKQISVVDKTGSIVSNLNIPDLKSLNIPSFSKPEQDSIASVLSSITKKIRLNNQTITLLERAAKLLNDYWFVQFDFPNAEGKPYRASGGEMVYNEQLKRDVPKGWKVKKFGTLFDVTKGELITEKDAEEGDVKVVAAGLTYSYLHSTPNRAANTITISASGANAGFVNFWREPIYASDCITVRGKDDLDTILAHLFLRFMQKAISKKATGSAQPHVYPDDIKELWVCDIPASLKEQLLNTLISMNDKAAFVLRETAELTALRDFLLPLLMNGQVRVCG